MNITEFMMLQCLNPLNTTQHEHYIVNIHKKTGKYHIFTNDI